MRGESLRGRRPPVVPAAVPRPSRCGHAADGLPPAGPCPEGHTYGTAARRSIPTRHSAAHESAARGTRFASGQPGPVVPGIGPGQRQPPGTGQQSITCTDSRCHRQPSGVSAVPRWPKGQPALLLPAPRRVAVAGPAAARACRAHHLPTWLLDWSSRTSPALRVLAVRAQAPRQALSAPLSATAFAGP